MKIKWIPLLLAAVMALSGCVSRPPDDSADDDFTAGSVNVDTPAPDTTADGLLLFEDYACYSGGYIEDGSGDMVENVAAVLVKNLSDEYLQVAELTFEVEGKQAVFQVSGLPAGDAAWVLEKNRLQISPDSEFHFVDSACGYLPDAVQYTNALPITLDNGSLTVQNKLEETVHDVYVYYKRLHEDGNCFGGITFRCSIGSLAQWETKEAVAGHCTPEGCRIVRIEWNKEEHKQ